MSITAIVAALMAIVLTALTLFDQQQAEAGLFDFGHLRKAPSAISGDNVYTAWQSNNTANGNEEIMFRAFTDRGLTFGDKINLSNTTDADSSRVEIDSDGDNVVVTWWEANRTAETPVMRVSIDDGATFGPLLRLATNGTIGVATE
jgi:hypothetical protein